MWVEPREQCSRPQRGGSFLYVPEQRAGASGAGADVA